MDKISGRLYVLPWTPYRLHYVHTVGVVDSELCFFLFSLWELFLFSSGLLGLILFFFVLHSFMFYFVLVAAYERVEHD